MVGFRKTRTSLFAAAVLGLGLQFGGCAKQTDDMVATNRSLQDQNARLQNELREANRIIAERDDATGRARSLIDEYQSQVAALEAQLDERDRALLAFEGELDRLDFTTLDPATDRALAQLAAQYPDLVSYDPDRGMLRFNSDLTFDSGSADVKAGARQTLAKLAGVLNAPAAQYVIEIEGHTDSQRLSSATAQRHRDNMHLSFHRAVAVRNALMQEGVPADRIKPSGWGPHRPIVANSATGNTPQNRRVEIYLKSDKWNGPRYAGETSQTREVDVDRPAPPRRAIDVTK